MVQGATKPNKASQSLREGMASVPPERPGKERTGGRQAALNCLRAEGVISQGRAKGGGFA